MASKTLKFSIMLTYDEDDQRASQEIALSGYLFDAINEVADKMKATYSWPEFEYVDEPVVQDWQMEELVKETVEAIKEARNEAVKVIN